MGLLREAEKKELKELFEKNLKEPVEITVFLDYEKNEDVSNIAKELMEEISGLTDKIIVKFIDSRSKEGENMLKEKNLLLDKWGDRRGPIFVFEKHPGVIYFGLPAGEEFPIFLEDLIHTSNNSVHVPLSAAKKISEVNVPLDIYVFVTPTCPYCPIMTHNSHQFAMLNKNIRGVMIEATEFPEFSEAFNVYAVPKNVIIYNGEKIMEWEGATPEATFAEYIEKSLEKIK